MPITKSKRRRALKAAERAQFGLQILSNKLQRPMTLARLEDASEHIEMLKVLLEDAHSAIRAAIWSTTTGR